MILRSSDVIAGPRVRRWTRDEYYRMAEVGLFQDQRVELIDGEIVEMSPQNSSHSMGIGLAQRALSRVFGEAFWIRIQMPLQFLGDSEPEPDLAVVRGNPREFSEHPSTALLVIEISESTLAFDTDRKASLYASFGIEDYWVVNLVERRVEVYRNPVSDAGADFGVRYGDVQKVGPGGFVSPLAMADAKIAVSDFLP